ncbi:MAG: tetratricopeptide repeat protein [Kofleriaceae bacterium]
MRRTWLLATVAACAGQPPERIDPRPPSRDAMARIAVASKHWLAGDVATAITELAAAGDDRQAHALLARAYVETGRVAEARELTARILAHAPPEPVLVHDVSRLDAIEISPDGVYVATIEPAPRYLTPATITIWNTLTGRAVFEVPGNRIAFGKASDGMPVIAVLVIESGILRVLDAATGVQRWTRDIGRSYDLAVDRRNTITTVSARSSTLEQWNLTTGATIRAIQNDSNAAVLGVSADGKTVLAADTLLDLGARPHKVSEFPGATIGSGIVERRVSPDGQTIAVANRSGTVTLEARDTKIRATLVAAGSQCEFLDDNTLVTNDGKRVIRWSATGAQLSAFELPATMRPLWRERIAIGPGGHVIVRAGAELAMLTATGTVVARLGFATRATALAWSQDGRTLAIATLAGEVMTWKVGAGVEPVSRQSAARLGFAADGTVLIDPPERPELAVDLDRAFVRDATHVLRYVELPEKVSAAVMAGTRLVTAGESGTIYLWNGGTGEGLGTIAGTTGIDALAIRADGHTLAVARSSGGIEIWDLPSRTRLLVLATWASGWFVTTPTGHFEGSPAPLQWKLGDVGFPGASFGTPEPGVAAATLAKPPAAVGFTRTPAAILPVHPCIDEDDLRPIYGELTGTTFTYCVALIRADPYCFALDLSSRALAAVRAPLDVIAPERASAEADEYSRIEAVDAGIKICPTATTCRTLPIRSPLGGRAALSADGAVFVLGGSGTDFVETYSASTGKRIARFRVRYGSATGDGAQSLELWAHNVVAIGTPCAGPCGEGNVYSITGKSLGALGLEATSLGYQQFHDDVWVLQGSNGDGFALRNARTNKTLASYQGSGEFLIQHDGQHVAAAISGGKVMVFDRNATAFEVAAPRCP